MDAISGMDFDYVASGHYANVIHPSGGEVNKASVLELSSDMVIILYQMEVFHLLTYDLYFFSSSYHSSASLCVTFTYIEPPWKF